MATVEEVDAALAQLLARLGRNDGGAGLVSERRTIEARCPDLDLVRWVVWDGGSLRELDEAPDGGSDVRVSVRSDDLVDIVAGELPVGRAYAAGRLRLDASLADLLRLRTLL